MAITRLRIATRKSPLALWQAEYVRDQLLGLHPGLHIELVPMSTQGDKILDVPLAKVGGKGLFVKELENGLLEGDADIAVHSIKDVPMEFPPGLHMPVVCRREDPRDAFVSRQFQRFDLLAQGARVGTSSLRRQCQLLEARPDLRLVSLRGNVGTRLGKLDSGECDAIILAAAGLNRLGLSHEIAEILDTAVSLPAVGQGAIGIECRLQDPAVEALIAALNHRDSQIQVAAERAFNRRLEGGCQVPIAGFAEFSENLLFMRGLVGTPDGKTMLRASISGKIQDAEELGQVLAEDLLNQGAGKILKEISTYG